MLTILKSRSVQIIRAMDTPIISDSLYYQTPRDQDVYVTVGVTIFNLSSQMRRLPMIHLFLTRLVLIHFPLEIIFVPYSRRNILFLPENVHKPMKKTLT